MHDEHLLSWGGLTLFILHFPKAHHAAFLLLLVFFFSFLSFSYRSFLLLLGKYFLKKVNLLYMVNSQELLNAYNWNLNKETFIVRIWQTFHFDLFTFHFFLFFFSSCFSHFDRIHINRNLHRICATTNCSLSIFDRDNRIQ